MSSDKPIIINNPAWGIGDATVYSWLMRSANEGGGRPIRMIARRNHEAFKFWGMEPYLLPDVDHPDMVTNYPQRGIVGGKDWLTLEFEHYGVGPCQRLRPIPQHTPGDLAEAEKIWVGRQRATGGGRRVLFFPDACYQIRMWTESGFSRVAYLMEQRGLSTITLFSKYRSHRFPFAYGGLSLRMMAALIQRADLVIGNESGPAHFSLTMGKQTAVMYGPSRPELTHAHCNETLIPFTGHGPCAGCQWKVENGYMAGVCVNNCDVIKGINPWTVADTLMTPEEKKSTKVVVFSPQSQGQAVFLKPMSQAAPPPVQVSVGGGLNRGVSADQTFLESVCSVLRERRIERALETGTYDGRGSTLQLAGALTRVSGMVSLVSIECNRDRALMATDFHEQMGNEHVQIEWGLSVMKDELPKVLDEVVVECHRAQSLGFPVDGPSAEAAAAAYMKETEHPCENDDLLRLHLSAFKPELVFLDSAGYIGWLEWQIVREWARPGLLVAMDDVRHIKHYRSLEDAKIRGWKILVESKSRYGAVLLEAP